MTTICQEDLIRLPNWNIRRVRLFYPIPEGYAPNPHGKNYREMKLYSIEKIRQIEASPAFQADVQRCRRRKRKVIYED